MSDQDVQEHYTGLDMGALKDTINEFASIGGDFGCKCQHCGLDPKGLVDRGDVIPVMYGPKGGPWWCSRCAETRWYQKNG